MAGKGMTFTVLDRSNLDRYERGLQALHADCRDEPVSARHWRWRYTEAPAGPARVIAALRDDAIVGTYACLPVRLAVGGRRLRAGLLGDLAVRDDERTWACYRELVSRCRDATAGDSLEADIAIVNGDTVDLARRVGMTCLGPQPVYARALDPGAALADRGAGRALVALAALARPLLDRPGASRQDGALACRPLERFDAAYDALWRSLERCRRATVVRDAAHMNWRYADCPDRDYVRVGAWGGGDLAGVVVWRRAARRSAVIVELLARADARGVLATLVAAAVAAARATGATHVVASFPAQAAEAAALRAGGFVRLPRRFAAGEVAVASRGNDGDLAAHLPHLYFSHGDSLL